MKKALSLLLALVMCLSLCACGAGDAQSNAKDNIHTAIVGEWIDISMGETFEFRSDLTGIYKGKEIKWSYDAKKQRYIVDKHGFIYESDISEVDGYKTIQVSGLSYMDMSYFDTYLSTVLSSEYSVIKDGLTKVVSGDMVKQTEYLDIVFIEACVSRTENDGYALEWQFSINNNAENPVKFGVMTTLHGTKNPPFGYKEVEVAAGANDLISVVFDFSESFSFSLLQKMQKAGAPITFCVYEGEAFKTDGNTGSILQDLTERHYIETDSINYSE